MKIELEVYNSSGYAEKTGLEIDWDGNKPFSKSYYDNYISPEQETLLHKILTCECALYALRRVTGSDGSNTDCMQDIRRRFINEYEKKFGEYKEFNDFW